ncbi:MAG: hypothetical protein ABI896_02685 [Actinomycetota bacterium]
MEPKVLLFDEPFGAQEADVLEPVAGGTVFVRPRREKVFQTL